MQDYRSHFRGAQGQFVSTAEFQAKDDAEAIMLARRLYSIHVESVRWRHGFELWQSDRLVFADGRK